MSQRFAHYAGLAFIMLALFCSGIHAAEVADTPEGRSAFAFDQAIQNYLKGNSSKSIKLLNEALKFKPDNQRARVFLLKILVERGSRLFLAKKFKKSYSYLSQAYHMDPENDQVRQMYELATKHVKPQQAASKVMLIPDEMKDKMLKQEAEAITRAQGGTVMKTVKTASGQEKQVVSESQGTLVQPVYSGAAVQQATVSGGASSALIMQEYAKNVSAMTNLMATFTKSQEQQMAQFMAPLERIQNLYYKSEEDRKKFMNQLDDRFKTILGNVNFQQRMVIYGFIIGLVILGGIAYVFYLIVRRMRSKREETIMKYQQEMLKMVRDMAGLPGSNTYGMLGSGGMAGAGHQLGAGMPMNQQQLMGQQGMMQPGMTQPGMAAAQPMDQVAQLEQVTKSGNYKERALAAVQILDLDAERALSIIKEMINDSDPFQRESMVFALGEHFHPLTLELLLEGLNDNEQRVVDAANRALKRLEQLPADVLNDESRNEIAQALGTATDTKKTKKKSSRSKKA